MLRILHLLAPAPFGGLERVVDMLVGGQAEAGLDAHAGLILEPGHVERQPLVDALRARDAAVHVLEGAPRAYLDERRRMGQLLDSLAPDVVHTHGYRTDVLHAGLARRRGIPQVTTVHGFTGGDLKNRAYELLQRRSFRRMDAVVAVSEPLRDQLLEYGVSKQRLHCVPNAWAGEREPASRAAARDHLGLDEAGFHIGFVGRLSEEKGPDVFVQALARIEGLDFTASIVGTGRDLHDLRQTVSRLGIGDRTVWHGMVQDAGHWLKAFDVMVLSSRTEGTPIVLFEAMAAGVPVVATRVGGVPGVVSGDEAVLVPSEDPAALASAIRTVADDPGGAADRAGRASQRLRTEYALDRWVDRYIEVYGMAGAV